MMHELDFYIAVDDSIRKMQETGNVIAMFNTNATIDSLLEIVLDFDVSMELIKPVRDKKSDKFIHNEESLF
jgi:hypothetical protein